MQLLAIDIGTRLQHILVLDSEHGPLRLTMPSATALLARAIEAATRRGEDLYLTGVTMGGGACTQAVRAHIHAGNHVYAAPEVALTFGDDLDAAREMGIELTEQGDRPSGTVRLELRDLDLSAIEHAFMAFGVRVRPDALAVAVFDHGVSAPGQDDGDSRLSYLTERLRADPSLYVLAHTRVDIPERFSRMRAVSMTTPLMVPLVVVDTAFAALLGSQLDPLVGEQQDLVLVNLGRLHTLAVHLRDSRVVGLFEHHTPRLTTDLLDELVVSLVERTLSPSNGDPSDGHGGLVLDPTPGPVSFFAVTGPRCDLVAGLRHVPHIAASRGGAEAVGCWGLARAYAHLYPDSRSWIEPMLLAGSLST